MEMRQVGAENGRGLRECGPRTVLIDDVLGSEASFGGADWRGDGDSRGIRSISDRRWFSSTDTDVSDCL